MARTINRSEDDAGAAPRSAMRRIREILRLALGEGHSHRAASAATGVPIATIADQLARARRAGLGWPLPDDMDDARLEARLFARPEAPPSAGRPLPDWPTVRCHEGPPASARAWLEVASFGCLAWRAVV